ncbi:hypothetical protein [uncultured Roseovarius sp.]|uniref:hypothetical protein n=1 Tax=uncultured Roseovarius sp. TaxID=293344 RepID=UPI002616D2A8|nr:hypothetical protein [uncultured Roseovarius sp.]
MGELIARTKGEAKKLGHDTYQTVTPCKNGHNAPRWTVSRQCVECQTMPRDKVYVERMRAAYLKAFDVTLRTGVAHVPILKDDGWWAIPVRDPSQPDDGTQADCVKINGD